MYMYIYIHMVHIHINGYISIHYKFALLLFRLGDIEDALKKIIKFVCSKSAFLVAFIEEGLKFSSSLYLMLIWIRVLKFVLENPAEVNKQMVNVPFFGKFQKMPTADNYIDCLVRSIAGLNITSAPDAPRVMRRLVELGDSENEEEQEEAPIPKKKKKAKKSKVATH